MTNEKQESRGNSAQKPSLRCPHPAWAVRASVDCSEVRFSLQTQHKCLPHGVREHTRGTAFRVSWRLMVKPPPVEETLTSPASHLSSSLAPFPHKASILGPLNRSYLPFNSTSCQSGHSLHDFSDYSLWKCTIILTFV